MLVIIANLNSLISSQQHFASVVKTARASQCLGLGREFLRNPPALEKVKKSLEKLACTSDFLKVFIPFIQCMLCHSHERVWRHLCWYMFVAPKGGSSTQNLSCQPKQCYSYLKQTKKEGKRCQREEKITPFKNYYLPKNSLSFINATWVEHLHTPLCVEFRSYWWNRWSYREPGA